MESPVYIFHPDEMAVLDSCDLPRYSETIQQLPAVSAMKTVFNGTEVHILMTDASVSDTVLAACEAGTGKRASWIPVRSFFAQDVPYTEDLPCFVGRAYGLIQWHAETRFCSRCGAPLSEHPSETARRCIPCNADYYPRLAPAIIVLVHKEDKILLVRHSHRIQHLFSCIAGYVEHGETLEQCVAREVLEEVGITVTNIRYAGSQSWPFPNQYMIAFHADWAAGEIAPDNVEILEGRWFDPDNLPNIPSPASVAWKLIMDRI